jgi:hypothetical protein
MQARHQLCDLRSHCLQLLVLLANAQAHQPIMIAQADSTLNTRLARYSTL